jgi:Xaa-Pro dipeptidase
MSAHAERRSRLAGTLPDTIDALLVTRLVNVLYLTGFSGSNGAVLIRRDAPPVLAVDGRYTIQAASQAPDLECIETRAVGVALVSYAKRAHVRRLGIEAGHVTLALSATLQDAGNGEVELIPMSPIVEPLRVVKDDAEVGSLRHACDITDRAFAALIAGLHAGVTEREVAWQLESAIHADGGDGLAFDTIVAFGPHSAVPHHQPTDRILSAGDFIKVDFGAKYCGYHADMTRTVVLGHAADWQRDLHAEVASIQAACRDRCEVGAVPVELDGIARQGIEAVGHHVHHGLGHGVGLEIHEDPFLTPGSTAGPLAQGMTVTIEPGIYIADRGGVRIEDTMLVGAKGATPLTTSPRDLLEVG